MPTASMHFSTCFGCNSMFTPSSFSTSALPHFELTDLLPCFATDAPAPPATNADAVDMLNVLHLSPPVPHVSTRNSIFGLMLKAFCLIILAHAVISPIVSPLSRNATRNAAICASVALPSIISFITDSVSCSDKDSLCTNLEIASCIILSASVNFLLSSRRSESKCFQGGTAPLQHEIFYALPPLQFQFQF